ncbi:MAG: hypothetical protein ACE5KO_04595, partial [Candidatus Bathyarchaeia archaeon]
TPEEHRSLSFGIVNSFTFVSAIVAPWATGIVRDATGLFSTALYVAAIVAVIGLVFTMLLRPAFRFSKEDDVYVAD